LAQLTLLIIPVALFTALGFLTPVDSFLVSHDSSLTTDATSLAPRPWPSAVLGFLASGSLVSYWMLGALVAGLVTAAEWVRRTLRAESTDLPTAE
jgi:hypothetical protein